VELKEVATAQGIYYHCRLVNAPGIQGGERGFGMSPDVLQQMLWHN